MLLEGLFNFQELRDYARKWVAKPGEPLIEADCKVINQNHKAAALVFEYAMKFDMQEKANMSFDVTKAGMKEKAMVDVRMMSNYDYAVLCLSLDYM